MCNRDRFYQDLTRIKVLPPQTGYAYVQDKDATEGDGDEHHGSDQGA
jgi:hypothetical protein